MAAPRRDDERARIYASALKLFNEKGYFATSYKDIAEACGITRSVVQHYYPRKDMFLELFFDEHLTVVLDRSRELCPPDSGMPELFCMMCLVHFSILITNGEGSQLVQDLLDSRSLTEDITTRKINWLVEKHPTGLDEQYVKDCLVAAIGGAYEVFSIATKEGRSLSAKYLTELAFLPFAISIGCERACAQKTIEECCSLRASL